MVPKIVFIVPYRDRESYLNMFTQFMPYLMEDYNEDDYEIYFSHQQDNRPFNRGAIKNLGFIAIKNKYPEDYKNITFVFNDIDTLPGKKNMLPYETNTNEIKHFYGYNFTLGGICSIKGEDFEKINGFPNFWGWGFEDNALQSRAIKQNIKINREVFYNISDKNILQFFNGLERTLDNNVVNKLNGDDGTNGLKTITNIKYYFDNIKPNYFFINFTEWTIPESHTNIIFEKRTNTRYVSQQKVNMGNIMAFSRR